MNRQQTMAVNKRLKVERGRSGGGHGAAGARRTRSGNIQDREETREKFKDGEAEVGTLSLGMKRLLFVSDRNMDKEIHTSTLSTHVQSSLADKRTF